MSNNTSAAPGTVFERTDASQTPDEHTRKSTTNTDGDRRGGESGTKPSAIEKRN